MIQSIQFKSIGKNPYPYGNIQRLGDMKNGRIIYQVIDSKGKEAGLLSVPQNEVDSFENAYEDIMETAPQIQRYAFENSSEKDIKKRRTMSRTMVAGGAILGAAIGIVLTNKSISTTRKILSTVAGIIGGISVGFLGYLAATTPDGTFKFIRATRTFSKLDIKPENNTN